MVHCFPLMILFTTHQSYGFTVNPCSCTRKYVRFCQNSRAACSVLLPYRALLSSAYTTGHPCHTHRLRIVHMWHQPLPTVPQFPVQFHMYQFIRMNAPGMSHVTMCHCSMVSIRHVRNRASMLIVGELVSS